MDSSVFYDVENVDFEKHVCVGNEPIPWSQGCLWRVCDATKRQSLWVRVKSATAISKNGICSIESETERTAFWSIMKKMHKHAIPHSDAEIQQKLCIDTEFMSIFEKGQPIVDVERIERLKSQQITCLAGVVIQIDFVWQTVKGVGVKVYGVQTNIQPCGDLKCRSCGEESGLKISTQTLVGEVSGLKNSTQISVSKDSGTSEVSGLKDNTQNTQSANTIELETQASQPRPRHQSTKYRHRRHSFRNNDNSRRKHNITIIIDSFHTKCRIYLNHASKRHCFV